MKVIVHVEEYFDPNAGYQINELLNVSKGNENKVYLITSNDMSPFHKSVDIIKDREFEKNTGVKIIRLNSRFKVSSRILLKGLWSEIDKLNPDLVFLHGIGDFKDLILYGKKRNYKIVRDCHMSWVASKHKYAKIYYKFFSIFFSNIINNTNKYEKIFALGCEEYEYLKTIGIKDKKIDYLYHGYNKEVIYYNELEREAVRNLYGFRRDDIVISYIGKFNNNKRPDLVLDIVGGLDKEILESNNIKLLFIGAKENNFMNVFNEKLNIFQNNIKIVIDDAKPFTELRKYFSASDICIYPKETTLSSIHAQVCGNPVIMENYKSNLERVVNKNNLYEQSNIKNAIKILEKIIVNKEYIKQKNLVINKESFKNREYKVQINKLNNIIERKL